MWSSRANSLENHPSHTARQSPLTVDKSPMGHRSHRTGLWSPSASKYQCRRRLLNPQGKLHQHHGDCGYRPPFLGNIGDSYRQLQVMKRSENCSRKFRLFQESKQGKHVAKKILIEFDRYWVMHPGQNVGIKVFFLDSCAQVSYLEIFLVFTLQFSSLDLYLLSISCFLLAGAPILPLVSHCFASHSVSQCQGTWETVGVAVLSVRSLLVHGYRVREDAGILRHPNTWRCELQVQVHGGILQPGNALHASAISWNPRGKIFVSN